MPKFVAESHHAFPLLSGLENIANNVMDLKSEIIELNDKFEEERKKNVKNVSPCSEDISIVKEELVEIKKVLSEVAKRPPAASSSRITVHKEKNNESNDNTSNRDRISRSKSPLIPSSSPPVQKQKIKLKVDPALHCGSVPVQGEVPKTNNVITVEQFSTILNKHVKPDSNVVKLQNKIQPPSIGHKGSNSITHLSFENCTTLAPVNGNNQGVGRIRGKFREDSEGFLTKIKRTDLKKNKEIVSLQAVKRDVEIYIGRLVENTKLENLMNYIENLLGIKVIRCRKLNCKIRICSSFKITIGGEDANKFFTSDIWPEGTDIREFLPYRPR
jgi:hypothetical protein